MVRLGFIRKVYGILSVQLFVTTIFSLLAMVSDSVKKFMINNFGILLLMLLLAIFLPCVIVCCNGQMRQFPQNYIILGVFTLAESYLIGFICAYTKPEVVFMAASMTFVMVASLTIYAITTKNDCENKELISNSPGYKCVWDTSCQLKQKLCSEYNYWNKCSGESC